MLWIAVQWEKTVELISSPCFVMRSPTTTRVSGRYAMRRLVFMEFKTNFLIQWFEMKLKKTFFTKTPCERENAKVWHFFWENRHCLKRTLLDHSRTLSVKTTYTTTADGRLFKPDRFKVVELMSRSPQCELIFLAFEEASLRIKLMFSLRTSRRPHTAWNE